MKGKKQIGEPTFDRHGYPTDWTLRTIEKWDMHRQDSRESWLGFCHSAFNETYGSWEQKNTRDSTALHVSTGGWSGNESVIYAMQTTLHWAIGWQSSVRGGHYELRWNHPKEDNAKHA